MSAVRHEDAVVRAQEAGDRRAAVVVAVFLALLIYSAVRTPVPAVNEPHYLAKAKHYWNPEFCRGDFFLESPDAHVVFFQTVGLLTNWLTLEQTAWVARGVSLLLLAIGWCSFVSRLLPGRWASLWVACVYLVIAALGQFSRLITIDDQSVRFLDLSGEWIVGGIEGKVFSYAFVFWAMGLWMAGCRHRAALCAGLAISFHPVVGVWSVAAGCFACAVCALPRLRHFDSSSPRPRVPASPRPKLYGAGVLALFVLAALPGLLPALKFANAASSKVENDAAFIQVAYRLAHHLDPMQIPWSAYASYVVLLIFWLVVRRFLRLGTGQSWFTAFIIGSVLIAGCGVILGWRDGGIAAMPYWAIRTRLLKFYWFRLADVMVPIAASIAFVGLVQQYFSRELSASTPRANRAGFVTGAIIAVLLIGSLFLPSPDRTPSQFTREQFADWKDACRWIAAETPSDAVFLTPTFGWGFKWHAGRAEFVNYKDIPQDAAGIVEWNSRLKSLSTWSRKEAGAGGGYSPESVDELQQICLKHQPQGIDYIVAVDDVFGPFQLPPVYENATCRVYRLSEVVPRVENR